MYKLEINGVYRGSFHSVGEAMAKVEEWARPFHMSWVVYDPWGNIYAQG